MFEEQRNIKNSISTTVYVNNVFTVELWKKNYITMDSISMYCMLSIVIKWVKSYSMYSGKIQA